MVSPVNWFCWPLPGWRAAESCAAALDTTRGAEVVVKVGKDGIVAIDDVVVAVLNDAVVAGTEFDWDEERADELSRWRRFPT